MDLPNVSRADPPFTRAAEVDLDVLENLLSFYFRAIDAELSRDLDSQLTSLPVARGKGKITALLLIDGHPGIRPSVVAELAMKDRSAMGRILDSFENAGLITRTISAGDSRAQELRVTDSGAALATKVRAIAVAQSSTFFDQIMSASDQKNLTEILKRAFVRLKERT